MKEAVISEVDEARMFIGNITKVPITVPEQKCTREKVRILFYRFAKNHWNPEFCPFELLW